MRRRRATPADPLRKVTLRLHTRVADAVRAQVALGVAASTDAFVEDAIMAYLREQRRERLYQAYHDAAGDAAFEASMADTSQMYEPGSADGLGNS